MATSGKRHKDLWLVGDIGSTNVRFALVDPDEGPGTLHHAATLRCADYAGLAAAAESFLQRVATARPRLGAIAVAGPVVGDQVSLTNLDWTFSLDRIAAELRLERLEALNDFTALALALPRLEPGDVAQVGGGGAVRDAPLAVIGPGTGLGVSGLVRAGREWVALSSEGGHAGVSPVTDREFAIARTLRGRFSRVSWERVLSGPGLVNLHAAICELEGVADRGGESASPPWIVEQALGGGSPVCREALEVFCALLGTAAGDLALTLGARGGVYLGGGIVPRIKDFLAQSAFRARFEAKGRLSPYAAAIPSYVITAPSPALIGGAVALAKSEQRG